MIEWLTSIIGQVPEQYQFIVYLTACVLVVITVTNAINLLFSPLKLFK